MAKFANWEMDIVNNTMKWSEEMYRIFGFLPNSFNPTLSTYYDYVHIEDKPKVEQFFDLLYRPKELQESFRDHIAIRDIILESGEKVYFAQTLKLLQPMHQLQQGLQPIQKEFRRDSLTLLD